MDNTLDQIKTINGTSKLSKLLILLDNFETTLGQFWDNFETSWRQLWGNFETTLGPHDGYLMTIGGRLGTKTLSLRSHLETN